MKIRALILASLLLITACTNEKADIPDIGEWQAEWIGAPWEGESFVPEAEHPTPEFRKCITLESGVKEARAYICGLGLFEMYINGQRVGEDYYRCSIPSRPRTSRSEILH